MGESSPFVPSEFAKIPLLSIKRQKEGQVTSASSTWPEWDGGRGHTLTATNVPPKRPCSLTPPAQVLSTSLAVTRDPRMGHSDTS